MGINSTKIIESYIPSIIEIKPNFENLKIENIDISFWKLNLLSIYKNKIYIAQSHEILEFSFNDLKNPQKRIDLQNGNVLYFF